MAAEDRELLEVLVRHGLSPEAAAAVQRLGERLREMSAEAGIEAAAMVDAATGEQMGAILAGGPFGVSIAPHLDAIRRTRGRAFVQLHTHVRSTSFSEDDAAVLAVHRRIVTVVVSAVDGTWYVLSEVTPRRPSRARAERIVGRFLDEYERLLATFRQRVSDGELTEADARREHPHQAWLNIREEVGLRYDRVGTPHESRTQGRRSAGN